MTLFPAAVLRWRATFICCNPLSSISRNACVGQTSIQACVPELRWLQRSHFCAIVSTISTTPKGQAIAHLLQPIHFARQLYAIGLESQSINRTSRNARGIVAVMAGHRIRSLAFPYNVDTRSKVTVTQRPVFLIMCHRTGNFTSMAAYTFRSFSSDKLIHLHPFHLMSYVFSNFAMQ